jgi:GxxExxY protein
MLYFAYGSNMNREQMLERCPTATIGQIGTLRDYRFLINQRGVATIVPEALKQVQGVVWNVSEHDLEELDEREGVAKGTYRRQTVTLSSADGRSVDAIAYVAANSLEGAPRAGYLEKVIEGATAAGLSEDYLEELRSSASPMSGQDTTIDFSNKQLKELALTIRALGEEVRQNLGCGFDEHIYQSALAIELRRNHIDYLREVNVEIFYKNESLGADRPDFVITKVGDCVESVILELKTADEISDAHRIQLKSYCKSFPLNNNPILTNFIGGILMAFPKGDIEEAGKTKIFVVNREFVVLKDDQEDEIRARQIKKQESDKAKKKKGT